MSEARESGIFSGLKVIDCASFIAGPAATTILSDFGADVVKVEPPGIGDPYRFLYRLAPNPVSEKNYTWQLTNRNKRSLALNLKDPDAGKVLQELIKTADVFVTNFPPHVRKGLGLTYEDISRENPTIIYADITGYGEYGPESDKPGFDITAYWARTGLMEATRDSGSPPSLPVFGIGDHAAATTLYSAIVTGLYRREKTGKGCNVSTSLIAEGTWAAAAWVQAALDGAKFPGHIDRKNPPNALANTYQCSDKKWLLLALVQEAKDWPGLVKALALEETLKDSNYADSEHRKRNASALVQILEEAFSKKPLSYWRAALDENHVTFGIVQSVEELARDPQLLANEILRPIDDGSSTPSLTVDSPMKIHQEKKVNPRLAPRLGQHTVEILEALGYDAPAIEKLSKSGAIFSQSTEQDKAIAK
jgi:crotonobetainyl-CoA:carnitine CoA-transferase CaiB-like acyl-CoA transferase